MFGDFGFVFKWWLYILLIGMLFLPFTQKYFRCFYDRGYGFSKAAGILILSYASWLLSSLGIFGSGRIYSFIVPLVLIPAAFFAAGRSDFPENIKEKRLIIILEELLFLGLLLFWSYVRGLQPDIYGLEKYMDFGFVNAILRADAMPPIDIWYAGAGINYYYFGHYICAYLARLTGIEAAVSYNLMIATLFALSFILTFSLSSNLLHLLTRYSMRKLILAGLIAASLLAFGGNLHSFLYGYGFMPTEGREYYYPDSTRYIGYNPSTDDKTIHEFPTYSFIVSDLHGHVSDIPTVLTFIALLLSCFAKREGVGRLGFAKAVLMGFLLSIMYMTNTWDYPIYITVLTITLLYRNLHHYFMPAGTQTKPVLKTLAVVLCIIAFSQLFALPYSMNFESISAGVGLVHYRTPFYQLAILWGYQFFYVLCFTVFLAVITVKRMRLQPKGKWPERLLNNVTVSDMLCLILCCCGLGLVLIPEVVYVIDIYYKGYHRANTMFKLTYQAFIMFCIAAGYIAVRVPSSINRKSLRSLAAALLLILYLLPMSYFPLALKGYYNTLSPSGYKGLDGLHFLKSKYPEDYEAVKWLNANVQGQPTILEAHGDSYSSYCRISTATGLPTVQGWYVHEWLWRNDKTGPAERGKEVQRVYESQDVEATMDIIRKYKVEYIILGDLERDKFMYLNEEKLLSLGEVVFEAGGTKVIAVRIK